MADSLLDVVDWDNLDSSEYVTAYRVLMSATSERIAIGAMRSDGSYTSGASSPFNPQGWQDAFPWASNDGEYGNDGEPYIPLTTQDCEDFLSKATELFIDHENITNLLGTNVHQVTRWTEARIFSHFSISAWPDLSILNATDLKKWYDILTGACKYISPLWGQTSSPKYIYQWSGIFDGSRAGAGGIASLYAEKDYAGNLANFNTDYGDLYTGPEVEDTDSGLTYEPNCGRPYWITAGSPSTLKALIYQTAIKLDYSTARSVIGFNGDPLSAEYYDNYSSNTTDYAQDVNELFENDLIFDFTSDILTATVEEPTITNPISGGLPSPSEAYVINRKNVNNDSSKFGFVAYRLIVNWDGEGGFDYYTP
jgi:hypothetical protein